MSQKTNEKLFGPMVMLFWMAMYTYQPQLSVYSGMLGAGAVMTGTILSSYGFTQMLCRVPIGIWSDCIRKRKIFVICGCAITGISALGMYFSTTPLMLLIFRAMSGVSASTWVTFTVLYSSYFDSKDSPRAMSGIMVFNNCGTLSAMLLGGFLSQKFGIPSSFLAAICISAAAVLMALQIRESVPETVTPIRPKDMVQVAGNKQLLTVSFFALMAQIIHQGATLGFTPKFAAGLGATSSQLGLLSAAAVLGSMSASYLNAHWSLKKFGAKRCVMTGQIILGTATVLLPIISKNVITVIVMQLIVGFGMGSSFPLLMGMAIRGIDTSRRGVAMGLFQSIYALGMFIGPLVTGFLIERFSIGTSISMIGCIGFAAFLLTAVTKLER